MRGAIDDRSSVADISFSVGDLYRSRLGQCASASSPETCGMAAAGTRRLASVARHVTAARTAAELAEPAAVPPPADGTAHRPRHAQLLGTPRLSQDLSDWSAADLVRRCQMLGASDAELNDALTSTTGVTAALAALAVALQPPPPEAATVEMLTVRDR